MTDTTSAARPQDSEILANELTQLEKLPLLAKSAALPRLAALLVAVIGRLENRICELEEKSQ